MTGEEFGSFLGETIDELESASLTIDEVISQLSDIDGKVIDLSENAGNSFDEESRITVSDLNDIVQSASSDLDFLVGEIEDVGDSLMSFDGSILRD